MSTVVKKFLLKLPLRLLPLTFVIFLSYVSVNGPDAMTRGLAQFMLICIGVLSLIFIATTLYVMGDRD